MSHYFHHNDTVMTVSRAVQAVNSLGGYAQRCVEAKSGVSHCHIIINGLRHGNNIQAFLLQQ